jgi:hypothetical protein
MARRRGFIFSRMESPIATFRVLGSSTVRMGTAHWAVDALSISWSNVKGYLFPPFSLQLIGRCAAKVRRDRTIATLITPYWPGQYWFPVGETGYDCNTFCREIRISGSTANFSVNLNSDQS